MDGEQLGLVVDEELLILSRVPLVRCARHYLDAQPTVAILRQPVDRLVAKQYAAVGDVAIVIPVLDPSAVEVQRSVDSLMDDDPSIDRHQQNSFVECRHGDLSG